MHRRAALSVSAALLAAAPLLSACGSSPARPGTAAVVGGERITTSAVQAEVKDVRAAQNRSPQGPALIQATAGLERHKLERMIQLALLERAAKDAGVRVSTAEVEAERERKLEQAGGRAQLEAAALQQAFLAPDQIDVDTRFKLLRDKLYDHYGSQDKAVEELRRTAEKLRVELNPRFGSWDPQQIGLGDKGTAWILQKSRPEQPVAGA
ncbi:SurA N-terminal domain-containing protein [Streptomyces antimicrobicus]|uniref:SurA N-terminal domain-containing protein n=1 Tax=Streptomyces antimicrobicus TaxID=2883108 RepID=A0ABS8B374_9ACTN|nr:SurA N-terminal domain-containing protein [Streptomyces antimicrobicus]MCB5179055.1 SurA N-terminal domain-containing protein [Streptomyces antimicrobicus]